MELFTCFPPGCVETGLCLPDGDAAAARLTELLDAAGCLWSKDAFLREMLACRSAPGVALGQGVAIPHAHGPFVKTGALCALTLQTPVPYGAESLSCRLFLGIAAPAEGFAHMELLSRAVMALAQPGLPAALCAAATPEAFLQLLAKGGQS